MGEVDHPQSAWTHALCGLCWSVAHGDQRPPHRLTPAELERCCGCGTPTRSGIYVRAHASELAFCPLRSQAPTPEVVPPEVVQRARDAFSSRRQP